MARHEGEKNWKNILPAWEDVVGAGPRQRGLATQQTDRLQPESAEWSGAVPLVLRPQDLTLVA